MAQKWIWQPTSEQIEQSNVKKMMDRLGLKTWQEFIRFSREQNEQFWDALVEEIQVEWFKPYERIVDSSAGPEWSRWFIDGKINVAWNCLDRHALGPGRERPACIWEGEDQSIRTITFGELAAQVNQLANALRALGIQKGDRVALYMPMVPEVLTILYACLKLGAIIVPIFSGFGPAAVATRLADSGARIIFTAGALERRGKSIELKRTAEEAIERGCAVEKIVVLPYKGTDISWKPRNLRWNELLQSQSEKFSALQLDSEDLALVLYTSGTTGKPKGTVHTHAGCLVQMAKEIYLAFDHKPEDRFYWVSDIGWMMGPWQIIGNHHFGGTIFLYDGAPHFPDADRFWKMIERHQITTFGVSPTAIRLLMTKNTNPRGYNLSSLRLLGSTGEPWDERSYFWFFEEVGQKRCPIINISGGTEIVGCFLFPLPIQPLKPCTLGGPAPGMGTEVFDESGKPVLRRNGYLVCTRPAPSMTRGLWNAPDQYLSTYWSRWKGVWNHGDWASVDEDGCWFLHGRADDALNVSGRKVGPAEIEEALTEVAGISEAAVIGIPHDIKGEEIVAFVVPASHLQVSDDLAEKACNHLVRSLGSVMRPGAIHIVPELPKTQSGKVVRRLIRQVYLGEDVGDFSTLENPKVLENFQKLGRS